MATHLATTVTFARERFGGASFNTAPHSPPVFQDIAHQQSPDNAKRLVVSRWDAEHYIGLALRGYSQCPCRKPLPDEMRSAVCDAPYIRGRHLNPRRGPPSSHLSVATPPDSEIKRDSEIMRIHRGPPSPAGGVQAGPDARL